MSFGELMERSLKDDKILQDIEKEINKCDVGLDRLIKPTFDIEFTDDMNVKSEDIFTDLLKRKITVQHSLNLFRNEEFFKNTSLHVISNVFDNFGENILRNGSSSVDDVTRAVVQYGVLFQVLSKRKDSTSEDVKGRKPIYRFNGERNERSDEETITRRLSACIYCDTKLSLCDKICPICEAEVIIRNTEETNIIETNHSANDDHFSYGESFSDDHIQPSKSTINSLRDSIITGTKVKDDIHPNISIKSNMGIVLKENNKVSLKMEWICFYCDERNYGDDQNCATCYTLKKESKMKTDNINGYKKVKNKDKSENLFLKNDLKVLKNIEVEAEKTLENPLGENSLQISVEDKSFKMVQINKVNISVEEIPKEIENKSLNPTNKCDWICSFCSFNNINIAVNCITCLVCYLEGKPSSEQMEIKEKEVNKGIVKGILHTIDKEKEIKVVSKDFQSTENENLYTNHSFTHGTRRHQTKEVGNDNSLTEILSSDEKNKLPQGHVGHKTQEEKSRSYQREKLSEVKESNCSNPFISLKSTKSMEKIGETSTNTKNVLEHSEIAPDIHREKKIREYSDMKDANIKKLRREESERAYDHENKKNIDQDRNEFFLNDRTGIGQVDMRKQTQNDSTKRLINRVNMEDYSQHDQMNIIKPPSARTQKQFESKIPKGNFIQSCFPWKKSSKLKKNEYHQINEETIRKSKKESKLNNSKTKLSSNCCPRCNKRKTSKMKTLF